MSTGEWSIPNLIIGKPLIITVAYTSASITGYIVYYVVSGTDDGFTTYTGTNGGFAIGHSNAWITTNSAILIPTNTTVVIKITTFFGPFVVYAYH